MSTRYTPRSKEKISHDKAIQNYGTKLRTFSSEGLDTAIAQLLKEANCKHLDIIDTTDTWGYTALIEASMWGHVDVIEMLLQHNAKVDSQSAAGETALHWAAMNGHNQVVSVLLHSGADPNAQQNKGQTPLHLAAQKNHPDIAKSLIRSGCNCNIKDKKNQVPFDLALPDSECAALLNRDVPQKRIQLLYVEKVNESEKMRQLNERLIHKMKAQRLEIKRLKKEMMGQQELIESLSSSVRNQRNVPALIKSEERQRKPRYFLSRAWGDDHDEESSKESTPNNMKLKLVTPVVNPAAALDAPEAATSSPPTSNEEASTPTTIHSPSARQMHTKTPATPKVDDHQMSKIRRAVQGHNRDDLYERFTQQKLASTSPLSSSFKSRSSDKTTKEPPNRRPDWSNNFSKKSLGSPGVVRTFF